MAQSSVIHIGFDDTDSPHGMCTTYLAYKIIDSLKKKNVEFVDYPRLIRFNPNIPWKTRGNGAVAISVRTDKPDQIKQSVKRLVDKYSDTRHGANPGLVFFERPKVPQEFTKFSKLALWQLISRNNAKKLVSKYKLESFHLGNGQGLVGAIGAIGYKFYDHTFELLSYRKKRQFGKSRKISNQSVAMVQQTLPKTFNSYDKEKNRILITPHGPDPVFYGVRGEDPKTVINASHIIKTGEKLQGYLVFKTNQGTNDHLRNTLDTLELRPYSSGVVEGIVSSKPITENGGHVFFTLSTNESKIICAVYKPTKITNIAQQLIKGDRIRVGGGIRKASKKHSRTLNVEFIQVLKLARKYVNANPICKKCDKRMKSKGVGQGFQCIKCKSFSQTKQICEVPRTIQKKVYLPSLLAHRHLTRPLQRYSKKNHETKINNKIPWFANFQN